MVAKAGFRRACAYVAFNSPYKTKSSYRCVTGDLRALSHKTSTVILGDLHGLSPCRVAMFAAKTMKRTHDVLDRLHIWRSFTSLPIIDVSALANTQQATEQEKLQVASALHKACRDVGFFYVTGHGVPTSTCNDVLQEARGWFRLPAAQKQKLALGPHTNFRGYQQLGANVTRYEGGFQRDWHEAIDLYREEDPRLLEARGAPPSPVHGRNQWPTQHAAFDAALREYFRACLQLGGTLMRGIALGLGLPERTFELPGNGGTTPDTSYWVSRVIYYPPLTQAISQSSASQGRPDRADHGEIERSVQLSCGEHTDYGLLTLVNQEDHVSALQVKNAAGKWISADPIPGSFVCNIGDMLRIWSNGLYTPTAHRVINADPTCSRVSVPFFYEPAFEAVIKPLSQLVSNARPACSSPVRYGTHLESKVLNNFELEGVGQPAAAVA